MEFEITVENITRLLLEFYKTGDTNLDKIAKSVLKAKQAWDLGFALLESEHCEIQYYGATCLYEKTSRHWQELSPELRLPFRDQVIYVVIRFSQQGPRNVFFKLSTVLSSLIIHSLIGRLRPSVRDAEGNGKNWANPLPEMFSLAAQQQTAQPDHACQTATMLLHVLSVLPEEIDKEFYPTNMRISLKFELTKSVDQVVDLIQSVLVASSDQCPMDLKDLALQCYHAWCQLGSIPMTTFQPLYRLLANYITIDDTAKSAFNALSASCLCLEAHRYPSCLNDLLEVFYHVRPMLESAIEAEDLELIDLISKMLVPYGENNTRFLINLYTTPVPASNENADALNHNKEIVYVFVNMILLCSTLPGRFPKDEEITDGCLSFWYQLQDEIMSSEGEMLMELLTVFRPMFMKVVDSLITKATLPSEKELRKLSADEKERFRIFRQDISDTLMYTYGILQTVLLSLFADRCVELVNSEASLSWQQLEVCLFGMTAIADGVPTDENTYLPKIFQLLTRLPNQERVLNSALYMLQAYSEWINYHPAVLNCVIPVILQSAMYKPLSQAATIALKDIARENREHIGPYADTVIDACQNVLNNNTLNPKDQMRMMTCASQTISALPLNEAFPKICLLLCAPIDKLKEVAQAEKLTESLVTDLQKPTQMITWFISGFSLDDNSVLAEYHPIVCLLAELLPYFQCLVQKCCQSLVARSSEVSLSELEDLIENLASLIERLCKQANGFLNQLIEPLASLIVQSYSAVPRACFLNVAKGLFVVYGREPMYFPIFSEFLSAITMKTCQMTQTTELRDDPDVTGVFLEMISLVFRKCQSFVQRYQHDFTPIIQVTITTSQFPEFPTVRTACQTLSNFFSAAENTELNRFSASLRQHCESLLEIVFQNIGGDSPRTVIEYFSSVLLSFVKYDAQFFTVVATRLMDRNALAPTSITVEQKTAFVKSLIREKSNKRVASSLITDYSDMARGIYGTDFATETKPSTQLC